jgi:5-methylcytosine-specific restriction enzyme A
MDVPPKEYAAKRSPKWPAVRKAWLTKHPYCAVCGIHDSLEVHHILPFHLNPELELDPTNLMTLCEGKTRTCHFIFGHFYNWLRYNANIREDAVVWTRKFERL